MVVPMGNGQEETTENQVGVKRVPIKPSAAKERLANEALLIGPLVDPEPRNTKTCKRGSQNQPISKPMNEDRKWRRCCKSCQKGMKNEWKKPPLLYPCPGRMPWKKRFGKPKQKQAE